MFVGLYRDAEGWVRVQDVTSLQFTIIPKIRYLASGATPQFDDLPMKEEYETRARTGVRR
jgi:hypothetical protein